MYAYIRECVCMCIYTYIYTHVCVYRRGQDVEREGIWEYLEGVKMT